MQTGIMSIFSLVLFGGALGCGVEPVSVVCDAAQAELQLTEIRGRQRGPDTRGHWVEAYNAATRVVDLQGLQVQTFRLDGSDAATWLVRTPVTVAAGHYTVFGLGADPVTPPAADHLLRSGDLSAPYAAGVMQLRDCRHQVVDEVAYRGLPESGTYARSGQGWCVDAVTEPAGLGDRLLVGAPGSPGKDNPSCES